MLDRVEIDEAGRVGVREATYFVEDGARVGPPAYHRYVLMPGETLDADEYGRVKQIAATVWTPDVVAAEAARAAAALASP